MSVSIPFLTPLSSVSTYENIDSSNVLSPSTTSTTCCFSNSCTSPGNDDPQYAVTELDTALSSAVSAKIHSLMPELDMNSTPLHEIVNWINNILTNAQCTRGVIIVALIYCERLLELNPLVQLTKNNWQSVVAVSILLASKVWDDISMQNGDYAYFLPFSLKQINEWERAFLKGLRYGVQVDCGRYEQCFFELRQTTNCLGLLDASKASVANQCKTTQN